MLSEKILGLLNGQIKKEFHSAYLYLGIEAYFRDMGLNGMANWFRIQVQEETDHAMKIYDYVVETGGLVRLGEIGAVASEYGTPLDAMKAAADHERYITRSIYEIVDAAIDEKDHKTNSFLKWFVDEQVGEEANADENVRNLELVKDHPNGLYMINKEMGTRVKQPQPDTAE
jgi:ferritin